MKKIVNSSGKGRQKSFLSHLQPKLKAQSAYPAYISDFIHLNFLLDLAMGLTHITYN